jgi:hypothetical protein
MAHNDSDSTNYTDDSADTASFQRFVEQEGQRPVQTGGGGSANGNGFRLLTLGIGALVLVAIVVLLLR